MLVNGIERSINADVDAVMQSEMWKEFENDQTAQTWREDVEEAEYIVMQVLNLPVCHYARQTAIGCLNKAFPWNAEWR